MMLLRRHELSGMQRRGVVASALLIATLAVFAHHAAPTAQMQAVHDVAVECVAVGVQVVATPAAPLALRFVAIGFIVVLPLLGVARVVSRRREGRLRSLALFVPLRC